MTSTCYKTEHDPWQGFSSIFSRVSSQQCYLWYLSKALIVMDTNEPASSHSSAIKPSAVKLPQPCLSDTHQRFPLSVYLLRCPQKTVSVTFAQRETTTWDSCHHFCSPLSGSLSPSPSPLCHPHHWVRSGLSPSNSFKLVLSAVPSRKHTTALLHSLFFYKNC